MVVASARNLHLFKLRRGINFMLLYGLCWIILSVFVGVLAAKIGRDGLSWAFVAIILSPFFAILGLLVVGKVIDEVVTDVKNSDDNLADDNEWAIIKKYVPEVQSSLKELDLQLDGKGLISAESKLKELFGVIGKEGLTNDSMRIIVNDVLTELAEEDARKLAQEVSTADEASTADNEDVSPKINVQLVEKLKGSKKVGFSKVVQQCDICSLAKTQQLIEAHHICGGCKMKYL
jgi:hypothetical protein